MADTEPRNVFDRAWTDHPQADYMTHRIFLRLVIERPSLDTKKFSILQFKTMGVIACFCFDLSENFPIAPY